jgi:hypothetical protein
MIKILSGFTGPGGSTVAFNNLVNLFNDNGIDACLYGPHEWEGITCNFKREEPLIKSEDTVIYHFMMPPATPCKKLILSCHETELFTMRKIEGITYDAVHFVSEFQMNWHGVKGNVIPNVITKYKSTPRHGRQPKVVGILGSIDQNKRVHKSIQRALEEGHDDIRIYGNITDGTYFATEVLPLLGEKVSYRGVSSDMQSVYGVITDVYASSKLECLPTIQGECIHLGINYHGLTESTRSDKDFEFNNEVILEKWKKLLF